jgi:SWI/SNF-related matrix-associated actin-dependent regulator of chromatin subfamily A3
LKLRLLIVSWVSLSQCDETLVWPDADQQHRMGQTRPVIAIKLMINNSVEQRLHKLQQKKANLAQISLNKLSRKDLMAQKAEELAELFK